MPRPPKPRWVEFEPSVTMFLPAGVPPGAIETVELTVDELEALRLKDVEDLDQEACAARMNVGQSTFQRLLAGARRKVAAALTGGKAIRIAGGHYLLAPRALRCGRCGHRWGRGHGGPGWTPGGGSGGAGRCHGGHGHGPWGRCPACGSPEVEPGG
ncbi:DUF134 domain-containing protein [Caldinitratiruptor microaerophilus]|uniref:UPF0251 protein caldi_31190 n=1 Tax=Caldinitratiruptor microaerophilus TaxID=671077 RepID=A0AA35GB64_9FIRM|nr:DUF134 domain-containing protein [Caldinitratiruptor microaerophilus]BDG62029.1 hypothetical protein caldi_31190 [Caldinitratiruptor microaerophilus]